MTHAHVEVERNINIAVENKNLVVQQYREWFKK